jgi:hypothetical protein
MEGTDRPLQERNTIRKAERLITDGDRECAHLHGHGAACHVIQRGGTPASSSGHDCGYIHQTCK